ncbi:MAG: hypothetical protein BroJett013_15960 [Alphaproteobacteria bacterium]|nr:MAG: hypothetical protein BroJett013_15960 [Alphaproteobacteria bacterium]
MTTIPLDHASPHGSRDQPEHNPRTGLKPKLRVLLFGLAPGGACRAAFLTVGAVGSYSTVSPLLRIAPLARLVRGGLFSVALSLEATFGIAPGGRYPPPYPRGARTFLDCAVSSIAAAAVRPTGVGFI